MKKKVYSIIAIMFIAAISIVQISLSFEDANSLSFSINEMFRTANADDESSNNCLGATYTNRKVKTGDICFCEATNAWVTKQSCEAGGSGCTEISCDK
jgi:hypothetical protein